MSAAIDPTMGIRLFPSGGVVPANLLRLHVVFPEPPDVEAATSSARLLDAAGNDVPHAFLDLPGGLWSSDGRRLTLILHPGRIKSGLAGRLAHGPAIEAGTAYAVEIDGGDRPVRFALQVGLAIITPLDPARWQATAPEIGATKPLRVMFDRVMDRESVAVALSVQDQENSPIEGSWLIETDGTAARFIPASPWRVRCVVLDAEPDLEDAAGNRPSIAFETPHAA